MAVRDVLRETAFGAVFGTIATGFASMGKRVFRLREDDGGFTTISMAVALTVSLALVLTSAQVYRVAADSSRVQDVADAAALAAENEVAEFMIAVRVCDAASLSLSLASILATGAGAAALCIPGGAAIGEKLVEAGQKIAQARTTFAQNAAKALNTLQKALPYLAAVNASTVARANNGQDHGNFFALAVLVSTTGQEITAGPESTAQELANDVSEEIQEIEEKARKAEEAAQGMANAKQKGFLADCGNYPGYCMYERALSLAGMDGSDNPFFGSAESWSFSAALRRAQSYYGWREAIEAPLDDSVDEQAKSALRRRFYAYANNALQLGYVYETSDSFEAYFPSLPRTVDEMKETSLYTELAYPVTGEGDERCMHAYEGCPAATGEVSWGSVEQLEQWGLEICEECGFCAEALGAVASASSVIANGFEYHYAIVAQAAEEYRQAKKAADPASSEVKTTLETILARLRSAFDSIATCRLEANPPGSYGVIVLAVDTQPASSPWFTSSLASESARLGLCAAVSAATLIEEESGEGASVIASLADTASWQSVAGGALDFVLTCWSNLLCAYSDGQESLEKGIESLLSSIPFMSQSGLGAWASARLQETIEGLGLQPANTNALKPVLVNSGLVAAGKDTEFSVRYRSLKEAALSTATETLSQDVFDISLSEIVESISGGSATVSGDEVVVTIEPFGPEGVSIPISITLPSFVREEGIGFVERTVNALQNLVSRLTGVGIWR